MRNGGQGSRNEVRAHLHAHLDAHPHAHSFPSRNHAQAHPHCHIHSFELSTQFHPTHSIRLVPSDSLLRPISYLRSYWHASSLMAARHGSPPSETTTRFLPTSTVGLSCGIWSQRTRMPCSGGSTPGIALMPHRHRDCMEAIYMYACALHCVIQVCSDARGDARRVVSRRGVLPSGMLMTIIIT